MRLRSALPPQCANTEADFTAAFGGHRRSRGKGGAPFPLSFFGMGRSPFHKNLPRSGADAAPHRAAATVPLSAGADPSGADPAERFLEHFAFETRPVATHHSGQDVFFVRIRATWWRLPPSRQQSGFNSWPPHPWQRSRPPEGGFRLRGTGTTG